MNLSRHAMHDRRRVSLVFALMCAFLCGAMLTTAILGARIATAGDHAQGGASTRFAIPHALDVEHEALHAALTKATAAGGKTGAAAKAVADLLHPHFVKEEQLALPPLALLERLARGELSNDMRDVLPLTDRLREALPQMLEEHRAIVSALGALTAAAREESKPDVVAFAENLALHAEMEEAVLYPSAVLVGAFVEAKLGRGSVP